MQGAAHNPTFARKVGIAPNVAKAFLSHGKKKK